MNASTPGRLTEPPAWHSAQTLTQHGAVRVQQRALPPLVLDLLLTIDIGLAVVLLLIAFGDRLIR